MRSLEAQQVIFMGQEPTIDPELPELARNLSWKFHYYNILLTNGFKVLPLDYFDKVVLSIKAHTDSLHHDYTGKSSKKALENFFTIYQSRVKLKCESILIPGYIDYEEIENIARFIAQVDKNIPYRIDAYLPVAHNPWPQPSIYSMEIAVNAAKNLSNVFCLTGGETLQYEVIRVVQECL